MGEMLIKIHEVLDIITDVATNVGNLHKYVSLN